MHLMKYTEWESPSGWHSGDVSDLAHMSNAWWYPARLLGLSPADYILFLNEYNLNSEILSIIFLLNSSSIVSI